MTAAVEGLSARVANFYEAFNYPRYPLLATARWQEAYAASPWFAARIARVPYLQDGRVLIAGSGEMLPSLIDRWTPRSQKITCIDLSRQSLWRARARLARQGSWGRLITGDLEDILASDKTSYQHIDAYGVVHHMADPGRALRHLSSRLNVGGTMRLMVYNSHARAFITRIQAALHILGADPHSRRDRMWVAAMLRDWQLDCPFIARRLQQIGTGTLANTARFADTFMHPREQSITYKGWHQAIEDAGFEICGLFDRYAELDDLPATLWQAPSVSEMTERIEDYRFENNLELYLRKGPANPEAASYSLRPSTPPKIWWSFGETEKLSFLKRQAVWKHFLRGDPLPDMPTHSAARLLRLGVIDPDSLPQGKRGRWLRPLCKDMQRPQYPQPTPLEKTRLPQLFGAYCRNPRLVERALAALNW